MKALAEALEGTDVSELDLTEDGVRIALRRRLEATVVIPMAQASSAVRAARPRANGAAPAPAPVAAPNPAEAGVAVIAPLTGVFYMASSPTAEPFAKVGDMVQAGQIICIVEAMKVFNEIKTEVSGVVASIPAQNGQLVQRGDALVRIKPL
ncbi:MAG TPA: acetyl-CoA carboxylase biotin carboxyl carrier protein [Ktedonobacterales bacterium]|nr:acetyl-CoA carboxylase biotin carboxyl carrier protein [Ktedonobacterales bacterium]